MIPDINLLPESEKETSKFKLLLLMLLSIWLLLFAWLLFTYFQTKNNHEFLQSTAKNLTIEKSALETNIANNEKEASQSLHNMIDYAESLTVPTSHLIEHLMELLPDHSYFIHYDYQNGKLTIEVHFETLNDVSQYVQNLTSSTLFHDVKVNEVDSFTLEEGESKKEVNHFSVIPRYAAKIELMVDRYALKQMGGKTGE